MKKFVPIIFASGLGTRLRPLTLKTPKPLLPFCNTTMLDENIKKFIKLGFSRLFINYSYGKNLFENVKQKYIDKIEIVLLQDIPASGHGGALRLLKPYLHPEIEYVLGVNGDTLVILPNDEVLTSYAESVLTFFGNKNLNGIPTDILVCKNSIVGTSTKSGRIFYTTCPAYSKENYIGMHIIPASFINLTTDAQPFVGTFESDGFIPLAINLGYTVRHENLPIRSFWSFNTHVEYEYVKSSFTQLKS